MIRALLLAIAASGCQYITDSFQDKPYSGDPFPIVVDTSSGAIVLGVGGDGSASRTAVLDLLSPVTVVDAGPKAPSVSYPVLTLLGESAPNVFDIPRAQLSAPQVISAHPCDDTCTSNGACAIGTPTAPVGYAVLLGINLFGGDALRLDLSREQLFLLPDIAGDDTHRTRSCDAVFDAPFRGGGTLVIGGSELGFTNWRVALPTCLVPDPSPALLQSQRGVDVLLVASTGIGVSLLGESAYARYQVGDSTAPPLASLPMDSACLPSGVVSGHRTTISTLALVGNPPAGTEPRAPCRQVYASHLLAQHDCTGAEDCPCLPGDPGTKTENNNQTFCGVPAVVELAPPGGLDVLVVSDDDPTLQSLRAELRPDQAEVDGILGANALSLLQLDVDYQHNRVLFRCVDTALCGARPQLLSSSDRPVLNGDCLAADRGPIATP